MLVPDAAAAVTIRMIAAKNARLLRERSSGGAIMAAVAATMAAPIPA